MGSGPCVVLTGQFWSSARPPWVSAHTAPRQAHRKLIPTEQAREERCLSGTVGGRWSPRSLFAVSGYLGREEKKGQLEQEDIPTLIHDRAVRKSAHRTPAPFAPATAPPPPPLPTPLRVNRRNRRPSAPDRPTRSTPGGKPAPARAPAAGPAVC